VPIGERIVQAFFFFRSIFKCKSVFISGFKCVIIRLNIYDEEGNILKLL